MERLVYKTGYSKQDTNSIISQESSYKEILKALVKKTVNLATRNKLSSTEVINEKITDKKSIVAILSPYYEDGEDGFYKRVRMVDKEILSDYKRVYLDCYRIDKNDFAVEEKDAKHLIIKFNSFNKSHIERLRSILEDVKVFYIHSVNMLIPDVVGMDFINYVFQDDHTKVLDVHGAVSDEFAMQGDMDRASLASLCEDIYISKADIIVTVSKKMADYFSKRTEIKTSICIPIFTTFEYDTQDKKYNRKPVIVYSGGLQVWQKKEQMLEFVKQNRKKANFKFCLTESKENEEYIEKLKACGCEVYFDNQQMMLESYRMSDYGILFRDDIIVNNVACPTKLIDYLTYGIVPILMNKNIGDFNELGMAYLKEEDFSKSQLPTIEEREKMAKKNSTLARKMSEERKLNIEQLKQMIEKGVMA